MPQGKKGGKKGATKRERTKGAPKGTPKGKRNLSGTQREAMQLSIEAMRRARAKHPKGRLPKGSIKVERDALIRERGGVPPTPGGTTMPSRSRSNGAGGFDGAVIDRTPAVSRPPRLGGKQFVINREYRVQWEPDDALAIAFAMLYAMRVRRAREDEDGARFDALVRQWFGMGGVDGDAGPMVNLDDEINMFVAVYKALPHAARQMGFSAEEWATSWNAIAGEEVGILPVGPPITPGLDAAYPPVRGTITQHFNPPEHLGIDIAAPLGTPVIAPEDLRITKVKTVGDYGNHIVAVSRRPADGKFPTYAGKLEGFVLPSEGTRRHTFAHLSTFAAGLKPGDEIERGAVIGYVGATGKATGNHLHWAVAVWLATDEGKVKITSMDPEDLVPGDVISGDTPARPASPSWTIVDPKDSTKTIEGPSYNLYGGGDVIFHGAKVVTKIGDVDVLSNAFAPPSEFEDFSRDAAPKAGSAARFGRGAGGLVGTLFGGPAGRVVGGKVGQAAGGVLDSLFGGQRRA